MTNEQAIVQTYEVRLSGGRGVEVEGDCMRVVDGCLVLERDGKLVNAWAKGWWEWVFIKEANDEAD